MFSCLFCFGSSKVTEQDESEWFDSLLFFPALFLKISSYKQGKSLGK